MTRHRQADRSTHTLINYCIATVWLVNGLFCKVLNLVPRHQQIVGQIVGEEYARNLTVLIGLAEIGMAIWIIVGWRMRFNAITQILIIAIMNIVEFVMVPDLLLWGKANSFFAFLLILIIYVNEFHLRQSSAK